MTVRSISVIHFLNIARMGIFQHAEIFGIDEGICCLSARLVYSRDVFQ